MHDGDLHGGDGAVALDLKNLKVISPLGRGAKGVVFLVETESGELLALKAMLRSSIEKKKKIASAGDGSEYRRICFEREVLASFHHPLLPRLHGVLATDKVVGYAIDYCSGRDLHCLRKKQTEKMFSDDVIRFYAAELVLALEYLHSLGVVYRDLKPENVMIQESGHLMLVDFDLSTRLAPRSPENRSVSSSDSDPLAKKPKPKKKLFSFRSRRRDSGISPVNREETESDSASTASESVDKSNSFVGTEEYVAPEVVLGNGHDFAVDWWCLGVMLYEMLYGATPFRGANRKETFYRIVTRAPDLTGESTPLRGLIGRLLEKDPRKRISAGEIKGHDYFKAVDWESITEMPRPPFIPELTDVGGTDGNNEIDVEKYVEGVFEEKAENNNRNKNAWVNKNHPTQIQNDNFLIF
ncbi:Serine/Threonine protein kinase, catalytic domain [Salvia divinorum]|uniref:non-specific serine/threonine protein kinase n=1 Tax=Salvia divinorum TaxID=28513 RepID=A0ABD1HM32_SALDI